MLKVLNNLDPYISGDEDENSDSEDAEFELELSNEEDNDNEIDSIDVAINSVVERNYNELSEETRVMTAKDGTNWTRIKLNDETKTRNRIVYTQASGCTNYSKQRIDSSVLFQLFQ